MLRFLYIFLPVEANLPATTCKGRWARESGSKQKALVLICCCCCSYGPKKSKTHESPVQDRKTKKLKSSNGWQLIRRKFVTIFDPQRHKICSNNTHPSNFLSFASLLLLVPHVLLLLLLLLFCLSVCLSVGPTEKRLRIFVKHYNRDTPHPLPF